MSMNNNLGDARQVTRTLQIIVAALMAGVTFFGAVVLFLIANDQGQPRQNEPFVAYVGAAFAAGLFVARVVVPNLIASSIARQAVASAPAQATPNLLFPAFMTSTIIANALLEGAGFFNLIAYLIDRQVWSLAIVCGLLAAMIFAFPTKSRLEDWASNQLTALQMDPALRPQD